MQTKAYYFPQYLKQTLVLIFVIPLKHPVDI